MATDFQKYGQPINLDTGAAKGAVDFSKYGTPMSEISTGPEKKVGAIQGFVQSIASPFLRTAVTGAGALGTGIDLFKSIGQKIGGKGDEALKTLEESKKETERRKKEGYNLGYFGQVKPLNSIKEGVGAGLEMGSYLVGGTGGVGLANAGLKQIIINAIKVGAKYETASGALMLGGAEMQKEGSTPTSILKESALGAGIGLAGGTILGSVIPLATQVANKTIRESVARESLGKIYRDTAAKYVEPQAILDNAEMVYKTDPISVLQMYGSKTLPDMAGGGASTKEGRAFLNQKIGELSNIKREGLFLENARVTLDEMVDYTDALIDSQSWSAAKKAAERKEAYKILREIADGYKNSPKYVDGIDLNELDLLKTEQTKLSKAYNNPKNAFSYDAHGVVGRMARDLVVEVSDNPLVGDLNKLVQSHYDAIDFLTALEGKKVHGGALSKMFTKLSGDIVGATIGSALGHPIAGAITGRVISSQIADVIQSQYITNPIKRMMIEALKEQAPKEVTAILKSMESKYKDIFEDMGLNQLLSESKKIVTSKTIANKITPSNKPIKVINTVTGEEKMLDLTSKANKKKSKVIIPPPIKEVNPVKKTKEKDLFPPQKEVKSAEKVIEDKNMFPTSKEIKDKAKNQKGFINEDVLLAGSAVAAGSIGLSKLSNYLSEKFPAEFKNEAPEKIPPQPAEVTMYNPTADQTDKTPTIMASGKKVYDGAIATSDYDMPFGTLIKFDGDDTIYTVEDRMNRRYSPDRYGKTVFDILNTDATSTGLKSAKEFGRQQKSYQIIGYDGR